MHSGSGRRLQVIESRREAGCAPKFPGSNEGEGQAAHPVEAGGLPVASSPMPSDHTQDAAVLGDETSGGGVVTRAVVEEEMRSVCNRTDRLFDVESNKIRVRIGATVGTGVDMDELCWEAVYLMQAVRRLGDLRLAVRQSCEQHEWQREPGDSQEANSSSKGDSCDQCQWYYFCSEEEMEAYAEGYRALSKRRRMRSGQARILTSQGRSGASTGEQEEHCAG